MMKKPSFLLEGPKLYCVVCLLLAVMVCLPASQAVGADIIIDNFSEVQGRVTAPGPATTSDFGVISSASPANVIGGHRYLRNTLTVGALGQEVYSEVPIGGLFTNSYSDTSEGQSYIIWSGADGNNTLALAANLCTASKFRVAFNSSDHPTTVNFHLRVFTTNTDYSTITFQSGTPPNVVELPFASFTDVGAGADFCNVGRIEYLVDTEADGQVALDYSLDYIDAPDELGFQCDNKTFNNVASLVLPSGTSMPTTFTARVAFTNTGDTTIPSGAMTITDTLDVGLSYFAWIGQEVGPVGAIVAPDSVAGQVVTWTNKVDLAAGAHVRFAYTVQANMSSGQSLTNGVEIKVPDADQNSTCEARVTFQTNGRVPAMNDVGMVIAFLAISLAGIYLYRRRAGRA